MIDVFMIFTMTIPLLEIIGHTYAETLKLEIGELDEILEHPRQSMTKILVLENFRKNKLHFSSSMKNKKWHSRPSSQELFYSRFLS